MDQEELLGAENQRLKEDLEALEGYINEFSEFLPLPICTVNPLNIVLGINQSFQNLTGYNAIEICGRDVTELFLEKQGIGSFVDEALRDSNRAVREMTLLAKNNVKIPVNVYGLSRKDDANNFIGYFLAISDISELKKSQEGLEERVSAKTKDLEESKRALVNILEDVDEARVRAEDERNKTLAVITNFTDGLLIFDKNGNLSLVNPQAETLMGIKSQDVVGSAFSKLKKIQVFGLLSEIIGKKSKGVARAEVKLKDALVLDVTRASIIREKENIGTLVVLHDITREKMIEKMKTEFVSLAAHQLRTPLSAIKWSLKMLLDEDLGKINEEQRGFMEKTYGSNERMISLINDLLNVTKIEEGRYLSNLALSDIDKIIRSVIDVYKDEVVKKGLSVEFNVPKAKLPPIKIDAEKIQLSFQNIFDNAVRYNRAKGKITVGLKRSKDEIEVSVQDTGMGVPKDQQKRVFSKFFRGENVMKKDTEGTGLGLFIAKNIIVSHGGRIWFESEEGKGSTFYFTLPLV